jgi:hypothetical protein
MKHLRGHVVLNTTANARDYCAMPPADARLLGAIFCGNHPPAALMVLPHPSRDARGTEYPFSLRAMIGDTMYHVPMFKTLTALREAGVEI